ncbi:glycosyltransferase family 90 protein [Coniophora puteana RWD-64-598 SS2]|uniref:Glycosyltransferase family 90 protein n=1 Tax=Coniophora puteana (strain RWD-64-598) TaxID=741705 RepID=A0A5M3MKU7_CONPW|nr:glycosyltransferase family 90 protein [Coniophora puteana RWD-64-598 SS2]EIW79444.1 glycosyltransferase family 90 protein [Coniophora puteana RWD-64-598 SS2]
MQAGLFAGHQDHAISLADSASSSSSSWIPSFLSTTKNTAAAALDADGRVHDHPIPHLIADAEAAFGAKLERQSKTLAQAAAEYRRRYGRDPPRGFDTWWAFAAEREFKMVDEFDGLVEDLAPFWNISGVELRRRALQAGELPSIDLVRIKNGESEIIKVPSRFQDSEGGSRARGFARLIAEFVDSLPDMDFPINAKAEGRILVPWEHKAYPNMTSFDTAAGIEAVLGKDFPADWAGGGNVWDSYRRTCAPDSQARRLLSAYRNPSADARRPLISSGSATSAAAQAEGGAEAAFVVSGINDVDFCDQPHEHYSQGHFFSDWRTFPVLYPIFSPAKARGFADIRIPSHYYLGGSSRYTYAFDEKHIKEGEIDPMEVPWEDKEEVIFWRGATTGGGSTPGGFSPYYQRHRLVRMSGDDPLKNLTILHPDASEPSVYAATTLPRAEVNKDIMDVAFTSATGAGYPGGEKALKEAHRFADAVPLGKHWSYKYLIDVDGQSYSGRFMSFLASDSAVLKSTVYKEYFSDWIQPWVHYVPVSSSYAELYNIYTYFSGPTPATLQAANQTQLETLDARKTETDAQLKRIARGGKQWKKTLGRIDDMEVYVYRLCLEYARLWADDREAMSYTS